ncbi:serine-enriched protein-like [Mytilus trossulus]|uniref:serine-enriched protein-like n=1 Tax=Mytilus trossulus TaxID=6551 RepID=UPI0030060AA0
MALFTSTPKSKRGEKVLLLNLDNSDDDVSSGYDSPVYISDENKDDKKTVTDKMVASDSSDDSDFSSDEADDDSSDDDSDDLDDIDDIQSTNDSMKVTKIQAVVDNIRYILSMPDLCDVMFLVGEQRIPVYGLKSILGIRSKNFLDMFIKQSREDMNSKKKLKKSKDEKQTSSSTKTTIIVGSYDIEVFRSFLLFLHCGSVTMDASTVVGLLCCAVEFDIADLKKACLEFVDTCLSSVSTDIVIKETFRYDDHSAAQKLRQVVLSRQTSMTLKTRNVTKQRQSPIGQETEV